MQSNSCKEKTHCTIGRENLQIQQPQSKTQQVKKSAAKTKVTHHPVTGQNFIAGWLAHSAAICDTVFSHAMEKIFPLHGVHLHLADNSAAH